MRSGRARFVAVVLCATVVFGGNGCSFPAKRAELQQEISRLEEKNRRLARVVAERDETVSAMKRQVADLQTLGSDRPVALFAPARIEIVSRSGGTDFDGMPGDDGVTVYVRPVDGEGDAVKSPGRIRLQVLDTSVVGEPRVLAVCRVESEEELRKTWHGRFGTNHFTVRCPFETGVTAPAAGKVTAVVDFLDYLSGATLTATRELAVKPARTQP